MVCERRQRQLTVVNGKTERLHYPALLILEELVDCMLERQRQMEREGWYQNWTEARGLAPVAPTGSGQPVA
jgi:hypothetical protein